MRAAAWALLLTVGAAGVSTDGLGAQAARSTGCALSSPLWSAQTGSTTQAARAWDSGRRDDGNCSGTLAAWLSSTYASSVETRRPDGLAAPSVGAVLSASAGYQFRRGPLEVRIMPELAWHQNEAVEIPGSSFDDARQYGYRWASIDLPFRFGPDAFSLIGAGRSGVRLHLANVSVGLDAEPVRWGPSRRYPLLLSGQQASLPRIGFRTEEPWDLGSFGTLDVNLLYARLSSSDWFNELDQEDRVMSGFALEWAPDVFPGLALGVASLHHQDADAFGLGSAFDWLASLTQSEGNTTSGNGLAGAWVSWGDPDLGFDVWVELLKDDFNRDLTQLLLEPGKGSGVTFGLRQEADWGAGRLSGHFELSRTRNARPATDDAVGGRGVMYTHFEVREGHTHRGQLLGAIVGPGGDGQFLEVAYTSRARTSLQLERLRHNTDAYTGVLGQPLGDEGYDVEIVGRLQHERSLGAARLRGELEVGGRHNRLFLQDDPGFEGNTRLSLMLMWSR